MNTATDSPVASPCTSVCTIDQRSGLCVGCWRTLDEIARWSTMSDPARRNVISAVAQRRNSLSDTDVVARGADGDC